MSRRSALAGLSALPLAAPAVAATAPPGRQPLALRYSVVLPDDYDMAAIRRRVAERAPHYDRLPGLGLKAFLIRERQRAGSTLNEYAPCYLWTEAAALRRFLLGSGFAGVQRSFGRPQARQELALGFGRGPAASARSAHRALTPTAPDVDLAQLATAEQRRIEEATGQVGVHSTWSALDTNSWQLVRYTLWDRPAERLPAEPDSIRYTLAHLSTPGIDQLGTD